MSDSSSDYESGGIESEVEFVHCNISCEVTLSPMILASSLSSSIEMNSIEVSVYIIKLTAFY